MKPLAILNRAAFLPEDRTRVDTWLRTAGYDVVDSVGGVPVQIVDISSEVAGRELVDSLRKVMVSAREGNLQ